MKVYSKGVAEVSSVPTIRVGSEAPKSLVVPVDRWG